MSNRNIGQEIIDGLREIKSGGGTIKYIEDPKTPREIRKDLDMTQFDFAIYMGISERTLQEWEQGRRKPTGSARALLRVAEKSPETFKRIWS